MDTYLKMNKIRRLYTFKEVCFVRDVKMTIDFIIELSCLIYGKQVFFYDFDTDIWYSRDHCRDVTYEEVLDWLKEYVYPMFYDE